MQWSAPNGSTNFDENVSLIQPNPEKRKKTKRRHIGLCDGEDVQWIVKMIKFEENEERSNTFDETTDIEASIH